MLTTRRVLLVLVVASMGVSIPRAAVARPGESSSGALTAGDFNGDGRMDIAVGVPGEARAGLSQVGIVHVFYSRANGLSTRDTEVWWRGARGIMGDPREDDLFGRALASGDFNNDGIDDLAVGVTGQDVTMIPDAGAVQILYGSRRGLKRAGDEIITLATNGLDGEPGLFDGWGQTMVADDLGRGAADDLVVGAPLKMIDGQQDAGAATLLYGSNDGLRTTDSVFIHQGLAAIEDEPDPQDRFGTSFAIADAGGSSSRDLAIGVPGEMVGGADGAGAVHVLFRSDGGVSPDNSDLVTQDSANVPGEPDDDDAFGFSLGGGDFLGNERADLAIGIPLESVGGRRAGAVAVLRGSSASLTARKTTLLSQATPGVIGEPQTQGLFGNSLGGAAFGRGSHHDLVVSAPDSEVQGVAGAGLVHVFYGSRSGFARGDNQVWHTGKPTVRGKPELNEAWGAALLGIDLGKTPHADLFASSPFDEINTNHEAGGSKAFYARRKGISARGEQSWHQDMDGVPDEAEPNDHFGLGEIKAVG